MTYKADEMVSITTIFVGTIPFINAKGPINQPEQYRFESVNAAIRQGYPLRIVETTTVKTTKEDEVARQAAADEAARVAEAAAKAKAEEEAARVAAAEEARKAAAAAAAKKAETSVKK